MARQVSRGKFIVIDGIDGAGKSLQTRLLQERLESRYAISCLSTREPGGSPLGEKIRLLLLQESSDCDDCGIDAITEALLFNAARRDHLRRVIVPALENGLWVLCDRFAFSSFAYQGAGGAGEELLTSLHRIALSEIFPGAELVADLGPDLGIVLDLAPEEAMQRSANKRGQASGKADNFERRGFDFFTRVRSIFLQQVRREQTRQEQTRREQTRWSVIDASETAERVADMIEQEVVSRFSLKPLTRKLARKLARKLTSELASEQS